jgi:hypothetical protein
MKDRIKFYRQNTPHHSGGSVAKTPITAKEKKSLFIFDSAFLGVFASWPFKCRYLLFFGVLLLVGPYSVSRSFAQTATPTPLSGTGDGAAATFYSNPNLTGTTFSTLAEEIGFDWFECSPDPSIPPSAFSGRFTAQLEPLYSETYTFSVVVQGGVSLIVNGSILISQWTNSANIVTYTGTIALTALQRVSLQVDYFKTTTPGQIELFWQSASQANELIPMAHLYSGLAPTPLPTPQTLTAACGQNLVVDGNVTGGEWSGPFTPIPKVAWGMNTGIPADFQTRWDSNNLYVGYRVYNTTPHNDSPEPFNDDSLEVYLDTANSHSATLTSTDFQFFLVWGKNASASGDPSGVLGQTLNTSYGYSGVLAIPWNVLGVTPSPGALYGFDVGIDLNTQGGCANSKLRWNGSINDNQDSRGLGQLSLGPPCPLATTQTPFFYPEPATGDYVNIAYNMREPGTMKLRVWNAAGNLAATLNDPKGAGPQISYLPIANFAAGHYFYQVTLAYDSGDEDRFKTKVLPIQK